MPVYWHSGIVIVLQMLVLQKPLLRRKAVAMPRGKIPLSFKRKNRRARNQKSPKSLAHFSLQRKMCDKSKKVCFWSPFYFLHF